MKNEESLNREKLIEKLTGVHCPSCGRETVQLEPLLKMYGDGYVVKCKSCFFRAETGATKEEALKNWKDEAFTETARMLSHPLKAEDLPDDGVMKLFESVNQQAHDEYTALLKRFGESRGLADDLLLQSYIADLRAEAARKEADEAVARMIADMGKAHSEERVIHRIPGLSESDADAAIRMMRKNVLGRETLDPVSRENFEPASDEEDEEGGINEID